MMDSRSSLALAIIGFFLALAVGLMLGYGLGSNGERRDAQYEGIVKQFELLRAQDQSVRDENDAVRRRVTANDQAIRQLLPVVVKDRLAGNTVSIILCGDPGEGRYWGDLESAIRQAGGEIGAIYRVPDHLRPMRSGVRQQLGTLWSAGMLSPDPEPYEAVGWLVRALARNAGRERIDDIIMPTGIERRRDALGPVHRLLVLTSISDEDRAARVSAGDVPEDAVVDAARGENIIVVAAEPEDTKPSAVEPLGRRGATTVDNIDTAAGQISAILALAGAEGHFGSKPGATPLPPLQTP